MRFIKRADIDIAPAELGAALANVGSDEQAEFFAAFMRELFRACGGEAQAQLQLAYVLDHLSPQQRRVLSMLAYEEEPAS
jgi:hypothetical protein